jgi:hypothetical protein
MPMLTNDEITAQGLDQLESELGPAAHTDRKKEGLFGNEPGKSNKGDTVRIRKPPLAEVNEAWEANYQSIDDDHVPMTMDKPKSIDWEITDVQMHLQLTDFEYQVSQPAMAALAMKWNREVMAMYKKAWNYVGVPETATSASADYLQVGVLMDNNLAPRDGSRAIFLNPRSMAAAIEANKALQHPGEVLSEGFRKGLYRKSVLGFDWHMTQIVLNHLSGANTGGGLIDGAGQSGASLLMDDFTAASAAFKEGDILDLTGYKDVNFQTKDSILGYARRVVVTQDVESDATGNETTVAIAPTLVLTGKNQNVSGTLADAEAVLLFGHASNYVSKTFPQCMAWPKAAIALGFVELKTPKGLDAGATKTDPKRGITMRFSRRWDQDSSSWKVRYQTFGGLAALRPEWIVRICG